MTHTSASQQIEAIHAMMSTGHHSVRIETHTLVIWGITAAILILFTGDLFSHEHFPDRLNRALGMTVFIASILTAVGILEFRLTRKNRLQRDETVSFVQTQLNKVWWMILGLIVIINLAMQFFGGGYMLYSLTLALMGMALYIHGLFSRQMLSWAGACMILLGLTTLATKLPLQLIEWIAIFCFGFGWPLLAWAINHRGVNKNQLHRLLFTLVWLSVILVPAYTATSLTSEPVNDIPDTQMSLDEYLQLEKLPVNKHVIHLPAGTLIPINFNIGGGILNSADRAELPLSLSSGMDIELHNGEPTGRFRIANNHWQKFKYDFRLRFTRFVSSITPEQGPRVNVDMSITSNGPYQNKSDKRSTD